MRPFAPNNQVLSPLTRKETLKAQAVCLKALSSWANGPFLDCEPLPVLKPLRATVKCQTYLTRLKDGLPVIVKRHAEAGNYIAELMALELLTGRGPVPELIASLDEANILVLEYLTRPFRTDSLETLCRVAQALGCLHGCMAEWADVLVQLFPQATVGKIIETGRSARGIDDREAYRKLLLSLMNLLGEDYLPWSLGDVKAEHVLAREDQCVFIDLETFKAGAPEQFDILSLINLAPDNRLAASEWNRVLDAYMSGRSSTGPYLSRAALKGSLRLAAQAYGLPKELAP